MTKHDFVKLVFGNLGKMALSKKETAMLIGGISTETLDRMRKDGEIRSKRIRGQVHFTLDEIYTCIYGD